MRKYREEFHAEAQRRRGRGGNSELTRSSTQIGGKAIPKTGAVLPFTPYYEHYADCNCNNTACNRKPHPKRQGVCFFAVLSG